MQVERAARPADRSISAMPVCRAGSRRDQIQGACDQRELDAHQEQNGRSGRAQRGRIQLQPGHDGDVEKRRDQEQGQDGDQQAQDFARQSGHLAASLISPRHAGKAQNKGFFP
jgi:hypothetical protein